MLEWSLPCGRVLGGPLALSHSRTRFVCTGVGGYWVGGLCTLLVGEPQERETVHAALRHEQGPPPWPRPHPAYVLAAFWLTFWRSDPRFRGSFFSPRFFLVWAFGDPFGMEARRPVFLLDVMT